MVMRTATGRLSALLTICFYFSDFLVKEEVDDSAIEFQPPEQDAIKVKRIFNEIIDKN